MIKKIVSLSTFLVISAVVFTGIMIAAAWPAIRLISPYFVSAMALIVATAAVVWLRSFIIRQGLTTRQESDSYHFKKAIMIGAARQVQKGLIFPNLVDDLQFRPHAKLKPDQQNGSVPFLESPIIKPILPELATRQRVLIVGASDSGKTTLLRFLIDIKGSVLVIDPHGSPPKWGDVKHIGQGRDYRAIGAILSWLIAEMNKRYGEIGSGSILEGEHPKVTVLIDEWRSITRNVKPAGGQISTLLTEARKANIDLVVSTHSERVRALGIEGEGDLRKGFSVVRLSGGNGEPRRATLSTNGGDEVEYALPGPYPDRSFTIQLEQKLLPIEGEVISDKPTMADPPQTEEDAWDSQIADEYLKSHSYSKCFRLLYRLKNGEDYGKKIGGHQTQKIKGILDKMGVNHPVKGV